MKIKQLETSDEQRIETGPIKFNDDWPGLFMRGDDAMRCSMMLKKVLAYIDDPASFTGLEAEIMRRYILSTSALMSTCEI